jgi:hypothetical protein
MTPISDRRTRKIRPSAEPLESRAYLTVVSFAAPVNLATASQSLSPVAVALADFNGDNKAELVLADSADNIDVLPGNGDGTFGTATLIPVIGSPVSLATGKFDTTGNLDIITGTNGSPGNISIIPGNGDGTFAAANNTAALNNNSEIAVGDFNNDGNADVITISNDPSATNNAMVLIGNGSDGAFVQSPFSLPFGSVSAVALGDFNGDGNLDVVVANQLNNSVSVLMGNGDGTFQPAQTYPTGPSPTSIIAGDFTGKALANGKPQLDIITADSTGGGISYLANNGDGTFAALVNTAITESATGGGPTIITGGDFNDDGKADVLALLSAGSSADAAILLGNGDGTFTPDATITTGGNARTGIAAGDLNANVGADVVLIDPTQITSLLSNVSATTLASTTTLTDPDSTFTVNTAATFTATVTDPTLAGTPTGSVNFDVNGVLSGTESLVNGSATFTTQFATTGSDSIVAVYSGDSSYSSSASSAFSITVNPVVVQTAILQPATVRNTLSPNVVSGVAARGVNVVNITNQSASLVKGFVTTNIFASSNGLGDGQSILVGSVKRQLSIKAGATVAVSVPVKLPTTLPAGSYMLVPQTVDPSANTSAAATGPMLTIAAPFISLVDSFAKLSIPATVVSGVKTPAFAQLRIVNNGNVPSSGLTPISILASPDGTAASGTVIKNFSLHLTIRAGRSALVRLALPLFPGVPDIVNSIVAQVTDPTGGISSITSSTTINLAAPVIDLSSPQLIVPATGTVGRPISVTLSITNNGNVFAKGTLQIAFTDTSDALPTVSVKINLKPGGTQRLKLRVPIPAGSQPGSQTLTANLDPMNTFEESDLTNNTVSSVVPIQLK